MKLFMWHKIRHYFLRRWHTLTFKILLFFSLTVLIVAIILGISFTNRIKPHFKSELLPNLARYIQYVVADIGSPPDLTRAKSLALELPFEMRIEGIDIEWSSRSDIQPISQYRLKRAPEPYQNYLVGSLRNYHYLLSIKGEYRYLFIVDSDFGDHQSRRHWLLFLVLGGILIGLYLLIHRLFIPIKVISRQVDKIGAGVFDHPIESEGGDELSVLANGINAMSTQIKSMLDGKAGLLLAISHELRSPITRMRVNLELLDESSTRDALIDDIKEMGQLVSSILESEKLSTAYAPLNRTTSHLAELIELVIEQHFPSQGIELSLSADDGFVDEFRFKLLLKNLLDNASHYSSNNAPAIKVSLTAQNEEVALSIRDYGSGISAEDLDHITEPFYRADSARQRSTGGYGLGLYLCHQIVQAHGGRIKITSQIDVGTTVSVFLPMSNPPT
jgi:signal transduction histidine kinase